MNNTGKNFNASFGPTALLGIGLNDVILPWDKKIFSSLWVLLWQLVSVKKERKKNNNNNLVSTSTCYLLGQYYDTNQQHLTKVLNCNCNGEGKLHHFSQSFSPNWETAGDSHLWRLRASLMEFLTTRQLLLAGRGEEASGSSMLGSLCKKREETCWRHTTDELCVLVNNRKWLYQRSWGIDGWNGLCLGFSDGDLRGKGEWMWEGAALTYVMLLGVSDTYNSSSFSVGVAVGGGRIRLLESWVVVRRCLHSRNTHGKDSVKLFTLNCVLDGQASANGPLSLCASWPPPLLSPPPPLPLQVTAVSLQQKQQQLRWRSPRPGRWPPLSGCWWRLVPCRRSVPPSPSCWPAVILLSALCQMKKTKKVRASDPTMSMV